MKRLLFMFIVLLCACAVSAAEKSWSWPGYPDEGALGSYLMNRYGYSKEKLENWEFWQWRWLHDKNQNDRLGKYTIEHVPGWGGGGGCGNPACTMCYGYNRTVPQWDESLREIAPLEIPEQPPKKPMGVPNAPTPQAMVGEMLKLAELTESDVLCDLGSGDGRIVIAAARDYGCRAVGIEIDEKSVARSKKAINDAELTNAHIIHADARRLHDLSNVTVVTMYLYPDLMRELTKQLDTLRPGARIISYMHKIPDAVEDKVLSVRDKNGVMHPIYLYIKRPPSTP